MEASILRQAISARSDTLRIHPQSKTWLPPWLFRNQELVLALEQAPKAEHETVMNSVNHIHFTGGCIFVLLRHSIYKESFLLKAYPEPCMGKTLTCRWADGQVSDLELDKLEFSSLIIDDRRSMILVPGLLKEMNQESLSIELPETNYAVGQRQAKRYLSAEVSAELMQSGFHAKGQLVDFSPSGFRLKVKPGASCSFRWFNSEEEASVHLKHNEKLVYSGKCLFVRESGNSRQREIVVAPIEEKIKRFKNKRIRNVRQRLVPSPQLVFHHPLLGKKIQRDIVDISTSGFSVCEEAQERVLVPGMVIPEAAINLAGSLKISCAAQVIHCQKNDDGKEIRCGIAILDMDIDAYSRLSHVLTNAMDPHAHISSEVDMEALWEFFFRAGFIYSKKYRLIQAQRETFKETYYKLYQEHPEVAKHFTYQKNGHIYGHISMVRAYEQAWMIHHHAALAMERKRTGFAVLKQMMYYLNDMHRLPSAHMDYVMCYFRPENKFPDRVFGGFAREFNNPRGCSLDLFAYLPYPTLSLGTDLPEGWSLNESSEADLWELNRYYRHSSGGLLLDALSIGPEGERSQSLEEAYAQVGLVRSWKVYSLCHRDEVNAMMIVNHSDLGFNLSELLNGIKVLVTNTEDLPWSVLSAAIGQLTREYQMARVPILFYPSKYVESNGIPCEKHYHMWILNVQYGNEYLDYMQEKFRITYS
jgi:hypothetical protein